MRYRIARRDTGWVVQLWDENDWIDMTRPIGWDKAVQIKDLLECVGNE